ncbi:hypothetical protein CAPTEDRAFT_192876 [Capitella teleta]|uniref:Uncharacterized protein n=1 Tax=Capitella teleta TaxID=283909 RepID=R7UE02_CAPTE|nr:hypothetical protein CAPTEDRAFT_192876 [Capitella teleta]|eukprot:ELU02003.1 hypothetical protein CAPTEDRAFT_192876 [Capitella teleta]
MQNPASYTTAMWALSSENLTPVPLAPPPSDGFCVLTSTHMSHSLCSSLMPCKRFDETYTRKLLCLTSPDDEDSDDLRLTPHSEDDEGSFEYDDDFYVFYE